MQWPVDSTPWQWGSGATHVRFRGRCGGLTITPPIHDEAAVRHANAEFYRGADWAMDISEAQFTGLSLVGVPADPTWSASRTAGEGRGWASCR